MAKLTKLQVLEIQKAYGEGKTCMELAGAYGVSQPTISYHINPGLKQRSIERTKKMYGELTADQKKALTNSKKEYIKVYMRNRYKNDMEFRKKAIARQILYNNKNKEEIKQEVNI